MNTEQRTDTGLVLRIDSPVIDAIYEIFGAGARWIRGNHIDMGGLPQEGEGKQNG